MRYNGSCHCGKVRFSFEHGAITSTIRCNCSICVRKGAAMSTFVVPKAEVAIEAEQGALAMYQFGSKVAEHYFCRTCGIYPFHGSMTKPGHIRFNLGCVEGLDVYALETSVFDGKSM
jgi:hypothetical protein